MEAVDEQLGLYGGVSQQDVSLRLPQQVEESINCYHTVESGLRKRNPASHIVGSDTGIVGNAFVYSYDRGRSGVFNEKYSIIWDGTLRAIDLNDGSSIPITGDVSYLAPFTSDTGYSAITVKDTTYITNRNVEVALTSSTTATQSSHGFVWVQRADPVDGYEYKVTVNGTTYTSTGKLSTSAAANHLATLIPNATASGNIIKVTAVTSISTSDNYGDMAISSFFQKVATEDDLPNNMPFDTVIEVGGETYGDDTYWLSSSNGLWEETIAPSTKYQIDASTMPHIIESHDDGLGNITFTISQGTWDNRKVGGNDNAKEPSFIGTGIADLFFFKNRLGFLTPNSIIFGETGQYSNWWKTTQVAVLDSDRIDVDIDAKKALRLHFVEFMQDDMIIFGDKSQFRISHEGALTPSNISATMIGAYDVNTDVRPLATADNIYFMAPNGSHNAMYMYSRDNISEISLATSVTQHIPQYLDNDIAQIVGSSVNNVIFLRSNTETDTIYVYKYLKDGKKLLQSAWFKWVFNSSIHSIFATESKLYILGTWNGSSTLGVMDIYPQPLMTDDPIPVTNSFLDGGTETYEARVELSEYLPRVGDTIRVSDKVSLKTILVNADDDSSFQLEIENTARGTSRTISEEYVLNRKPHVMGKASETKITITNSANSGFEINGIAIESRINNRSKLI